MVGKVLRAGMVLAAATLVSCYHNDNYNAGTAYVTSAVALADVNGDHRLDLVSVTGSYPGGPGFIGVRLQDPSQPGGFQASVHTGASSTPGALAVGDLGGGTGIGVVVVDTQTGVTANPANTVSVYPPNPAVPGAFLAPAVLQLGSRNPQGAALGALTTSGLADVAVAADGGSTLLVFFQTAPGTFAAPVSLPVGGVPAAVAMGDLNGDGLPDLAVATTGNVVSVLLQDPANPGSFLPHVDYPVGSNPLAVAIADLDGDQRPDLVTANFGTNLSPTTQGLSVLLQVPAPAAPGTFLPAVPYDAGDYGSCSVAVGDLDGDNRPDLVLANYGLPGSSGSLSVFLQDPAHPGAFLAPTLYRGGYGPTWVAIGDLNGDGLPDLASADGNVVVRFQVSGQPGVFGPPVAYWP